METNSFDFVPRFVALIEFYCQELKSGSCKMTPAETETVSRGRALLSALSGIKEIRLMTDELIADLDAWLSVAAAALEQRRRLLEENARLREQIEIERLNPSRSAIAPPPRGSSGRETVRFRARFFWISVVK